MGYFEERTNLNSIAIYLERIGVPYRLKDIADSEGTVFPALICTYQCQNLDFDVILYNLNKWVHVKCMIMNTTTLNLDPKILLSLYKLCLDLNYSLPESTFSTFKDDIFIEIDCLVNVSFEDFKAEFTSIGEGIEAFIQAVNRDKEITVKSTKGMVKDGSHARRFE